MDHLVQKFLVVFLISCLVGPCSQMRTDSEDQSDVTSLTEKLQEEKGKREKLEGDLEKITSLVYELLKSVNKLTKEYVSKKDIEDIKNGLAKNEKKLGEIVKKQEENNSDGDIDSKISVVFDSIRDSKDSVTAIVEDALYSMNKKFDDLKSDMMSKLESKVKGSNEGGKFVSEEAFKVVAGEVESLKEFPEKLNAKVEKTFSKLSEGKTEQTITRDEFAQFQLLLARDTSHLRVGNILSSSQI